MSKYNAPWPKDNWPEGTSLKNMDLLKEQNYSVHDWHDHWWQKPQNDWEPLTDEEQFGEEQEVY